MTWQCPKCKRWAGMAFYTASGELRCAWCVNRKVFPFQPVFNPPKR